MGLAALCANASMAGVWCRRGDKLRQTVKLWGWRTSSLGLSSLVTISFGNNSHIRRQWYVDAVCSFRGVCDGVLSCAALSYFVDHATSTWQVIHVLTLRS
jgi:hypothetical protein